MVRKNRFDGRHRGFSLAEVLVATAVFAIIVVAILLVYDTNNRSFSKGSQALDMQQSTRVAYEKLVGDVRLAGFDYKRGGVPLTSVPQWRPSLPYTVGLLIVPPTANGHYYRCTTAGTSSASAASVTWNTGTGSTSGDNGIVWTESGLTGNAYDQPDEQIEYAGATAITVRANYNYNNPDDATHYEHGRERNLESTQFPVVTTGNNEIVTYALVSTGDTTKNTGTITFYADVNNGGTPSRTSYPGGNKERAITITGVDLTNANPPYTLNQYTLDDAGGVVTTPLADNIRSLNFTYYQDTGARTQLQNDASPPVAVTDVMDSASTDAYDPADPATSAKIANRIIRSKIRAVSVRLVGMNSTSDANYDDQSVASVTVCGSGAGCGSGYTSPPAVTFTSGGGSGATAVSSISAGKVMGVTIINPGTGYTSAPTVSFSGGAGSGATATAALDTVAPHYRKFSLQSTIVPRNLGVTGIGPQSSNPPSAPTLKSVCYGYCGVAVVTWTPGPNSSNTSYTVVWDSSASGSFSNSQSAGTATTWSVDLTQSLSTATHYYFRVIATNSVGSTNSTNTLDVDTKNATIPATPALTATVSSPGTPVPGKVTLKWTAPTTSTGAACNPSTETPLTQTVGAELQGYRIFRYTSANFTPTTPGVVRVLDENGNGPLGTAVSPSPQADGSGHFSWDDTSVANCVDYYYEIQAVEWCWASGSYNTSTHASDGLSATNATGVHGYASTGTLPKAPTNLVVDATTTCSFATNKCYPVKLNWDKVIKDTSNNPMSVDVYHIYRVQNKNGVPYAGSVAADVGPLSGQVGVATPITFSEPLSSNLADHDPSDGVKFTYDYYVTADSCGESAKSNTVTVNACTTGATVSAIGASGGAGTSASPWQGPTSLQLGMPGGASAKVSLDGAASVAMSSPWTFPWPDTGDGASHTVDFIVTTATCTEDFRRYVVDTPATCTLTKVLTGVGSPITEIDITVTNSDNVPLTITGIDMTYNGSSDNKLIWFGLIFPSGTELTTGGSAKSLTSTSFAPSGADATIPATGSGSALWKMHFTTTGPGAGNPSTGHVTSVVVHYKSSHTGATTLDCTLVP